MEIKVPELTEVAVLLEPDGRVTRGSERPEPVRGAVSLGLPLVQPITSELAGDDAALRTLLDDQAWSFHLVHLGATFSPHTDARFGQAWLTVQLSRDDGAEAQPPIVWSLTPQRSAQPIERPLSLTLGASLLFEASIEVATTIRRMEVFGKATGCRNQPAPGSSPRHRWTRSAARSGSPSSRAPRERSPSPAWWTCAPR